MTGLSVLISCCQFPEGLFMLFIWDWMTLLLFICRYLFWIFFGRGGGKRELFHLLTAFPVNVTVPEIRSALRKDGPVITDLGNMIIDVRYILITISTLCFPQMKLWYRTLWTRILKVLFYFWTSVIVLSMSCVLELYWLNSPFDFVVLAAN